VLQYPLTYYRIKLGFSVALVTLMLCVVIAAVTAIFAIRFAIERTKGEALLLTQIPPTPCAAHQPSRPLVGVISGIAASPYAGTLASVLNSLQITVLNAWYSRLAIALNQWENHRTDTQYQDALTAKLFAFQVRANTQRTRNTASLANTASDTCTRRLKTRRQHLVQLLMWCCFLIVSVCGVMQFVNSYSSMAYIAFIQVSCQHYSISPCHCLI
jgi:hypothetical protein